MLLLDQNVRLYIGLPLALKLAGSGNVAFRPKCKAISLPLSLKLGGSRNAAFRPKCKAIGLPLALKLAGSGNAAFRPKCKAIYRLTFGVKIGWFWKCCF